MYCARTPASLLGDGHLPTEEVRTHLGEQDEANQLGRQRQQGSPIPWVTKISEAELRRYVVVLGIRRRHGSLKQKCGVVMSECGYRH